MKFVKLQGILIVFVGHLNFVVDKDFLYGNFNLFRNYYNFCFFMT